MKELSFWGSIERISSFVHGQDIENKLARISFQKCSRRFQPFLLIWFLVLKRHSLGLLFTVIENHKVFHYPRDCFFWNRQRNSCEWIKGNGLSIAVRANHFWFVLTGHQVNNNGLIPLNVGFPTFISDDRIFSSSTLYWFHIGLLLNSVQIFMKAIDNKREKFLRIMLGITWKHGVNWTDGSFQVIRRKRRFGLTPHVLNEFSIRFC